MKITAILILAGCLQVSAKTYSQITLKEKNASLLKVFNEIKTQSGYDFLYNSELLEKTGMVTVDLKDATLQQALDACLEGKSLNYTIEEKTVVVYPDPKKIPDKVIPPPPIKITVQGRIVNESGIPISGVTVTVKGTTNATATNDNGVFLLADVNENATLIFTATNIETSEMALHGRTNLILSFKTKISPLDEVQIQAYGTISRRLSTSDITTVKAEDLAKQPVDNPLLALQGRVPGLIITPSSGVPGASIKVQLRGQNSLVVDNLGKFVNTEPLYVIDGVPFTNNIPNLGGAQQTTSPNMSALSFINKSDIESIDVLKDADATAIYGSRGANGVILITTKKGKPGSTRVDVDVSTGIGQVAKKLDLLNTTQYLQMRREAFANDGIDFNNPPYNSPGMQNSVAADLFIWDTTRNTDWQKQLLGGTASYQKAEASISGGSATVQYRIGGTYNKQGYVFPGEAKHENGAGSFNITGISRNQRLRTSLTGGYTANTTTSPPDFTSRAVWLPPNAPSIYKSNGELNWEPNPLTGFGTWVNPYASLLSVTDAKSSLINTNVDISYHLFKALILKTTAGFSDVQGNSFSPFPILSIDPKRRSSYVRTSTFLTNRSKSSSIEPQVLYHVNISKGRLDALGGASIQNQRVESTELDASGFSDDSQLRSWSAASGLRGRNTSLNYKYAAVFGRLNYNWQNKYLLDIDARRDGSSRFGPGRRWGNFGSLAGSWIFTQEPFIKKGLLSFGKIRLSYGKSGNDGIPDYGYMELFSNTPGVTYQGVTTQSTSGVTNPYYAWETVNKGELGLDLGFFHDRILISAAYFQNLSTDLLGEYSLPSTAGLGQFIANQNAKIQNSGLELTLNTTNISTKNFKWTTSGNLSILRNKLLSVPATRGYGAFIDSSHVGQPFAGVAYVADFREVDPATGLYQFADHEGKTIAISGPVDPYGTKVMTSPKFFGGIDNTFTYKGLSVDVFLQFKKQLGLNYLYDGVFGGIGGPGVFYSTSAGRGNGTGNQPLEVLSRWQKPGDNASIQRFSTSRGGDTRNAWQMASNSDQAWVDASFIRLKNVSVSYSIPESWKQKLKLKNLRFYLSGQNLLTITKYKGFDPETQSLSALPPLRVVTTGIQIGL